MIYRTRLATIGVIILALVVIYLPGLSKSGPDRWTDDPDIATYPEPGATAVEGTAEPYPTMTITPIAATPMPFSGHGGSLRLQ